MESFNEKGPGEAVVLTFDFSQFLAPLTGVVLTGTPVVTFENVYGGDPNPSAMINGTPDIDPTNMLVWVPVAGGLDQNNYIVSVTCPTTNGSWTPALPAILPVRAFPSMPGVP